MKLTVAPDHPFSKANLPYGVFESDRPGPRVGVAIGDHVLDMYSLAPQVGIEREAFLQPSLNALLEHDRATLGRLRNRLKELVDQDIDQAHLLAHQQVRMRLPVEPGDFVDFYSSLEHATNVGIMFRGPERALNPNWRHLPVGYHGRCSSLQPSGQPVLRPRGQVLVGEDTPDYQISQRLDFELEMGFVVRGRTRPGQVLTPAQAEEHIFGMVLVNDWSARDIQRWEYVPLGPFLGKSFATSLSPWVVPIEALEPFRINGPAQDPPVLPHLQLEGRHHFDIPLEVEIATGDGQRAVVSRSNHRYLYWSMSQQLAHLTSNGTVIRPGDLLASGTISGPTPDSLGSLLELSWNGQRKVMVGSASRVFLEDGDTVTFRGGQPGVGFGECRATVKEPPHDTDK
ncbi:MAG: fumarylacetoacetase [Candidatus Eremiobacteraeota bacterium]|nr:fumarylacetoacetase [Candidatus Eremiobacteraeota bacterium]